MLMSTTSGEKGSMGKSVTAPCTDSQPRGSGVFLCGESNAIAGQSVLKEFQALGRKCPHNTGRKYIRDPLQIIVRDRVLPWAKFIWRRQWHPTPVLLPGKSHGQRSLVGYSPWGCMLQVLLLT